MASLDAAGPDRRHGTLVPGTEAIHRIKLNGVEPMAWLTDVLERVVSGRTKAAELETLLPWNWKPSSSAAPTAIAA